MKVGKQVAEVLSVLLVVALFPMGGCAASDREEVAQPAASEVASSSASSAAPEDDVVLSDDDLKALDDFSTKTASLVLQSDDDAVNYSPASLYFALALLEAGTEGEARQQLLDLMGFADSAALEKACARWMGTLESDAESREDRSETLKIANSVWADEAFSFSPEYLRTIREYYAAEAESVPLRAGGGGQRITDWIADATNDLIELDPRTFESSDIMAVLVNAIYFKDGWVEKFDPEATTKDVFYGASRTVSADMMHQRVTGGSYRHDDRFGMNLAELGFLDGGRMVFALPDEDVSLDDIVRNEGALASLLRGAGDSTYTINWTVPRLTLKSSIERLVSVLEELGVTKMFEGASPENGLVLFADDSPGACLTDVVQHTYMDVHEEGVEAAAVTTMEFASACINEESNEVDFTLDRPFLAALVSSEGIPLFMARVNDVDGEPVA